MSDSPLRRAARRAPLLASLLLCACGLDAATPTFIKIDNSTLSVDSIVRTSMRVPGGRNLLDFSLRVDIGQNVRIENHGIEPRVYSIWAYYLQGFVTRPQAMNVTESTNYLTGGKPETTREGSISFLRGPSDFAPLAGAWDGVLRRTDGTVVVVTATFNGTGGITAWGETPGTPTTGAVIHPGEAAYRFDLNDGRSIVADVDATTTRLALFEGDDVIGILEKSAPAAPTFTQADLAGTWTGTRLLLSGTVPDLTELRPVTGTTSATGTLALVDDAGLHLASTADLLLDNSAAGLYVGTAGDELIAASTCRAFLSRDLSLLVLTYGTGTPAQRAFVSLRRVP